MSMFKINFNLEVELEVEPRTGYIREAVMCSVMIKQYKNDLYAK